MLIVVAGLPGAGKSAVATGLGRALRAPVISVDPIEAAMWRAGIDRSQPTGLAAYVVAETCAADVIALDQKAIIDAVNGVELARAQWRSLAGRLGVPLRIIEVVCSDVQLHRRRVEQRRREIAGFPKLSWADVERARPQYEPWADERLVLDTVDDLSDNLTRAVAYIDGG